MSLEDRDLDQRITKACHALSIDDKRSTFHPLLWDETDQIRFRDTDHTDDETLTRSGLQACIPILEAAIQMTA
jgi:T6SS, Phospholipase effector Tle1-like, catalytic domain